MPLSGPYADQGKKLAELTKYGIEDYLNGYISINTYDVATEDYIRQAAEKMAQNKTQIILGPLFTPSVKSLENFAKNHNILMITLSNNPGIGEENLIYVFGHMPLKQTYSLLGYLFSKGYSDYAILTPHTKTSQNLSNALSEIIVSGGGKIFASQQYNGTKEAIEESVKTISEAVDQILEDENKDTKPVIIIAEENYDNIVTLFDEIKKNNLDTKAVVAGDSRIDINYKPGIKLIFTGSSYAASGMLAEKAGVNLGIKHFNYLENLAYDLGSLTATSVGVSYSRETFMNRFKSPVWFDGLSGSVRFNGPIAERKYSIIERSESGYKILHNASHAHEKEAKGKH